MLLKEVRDRIDSDGNVYFEMAIEESPFQSATVKRLSEDEKVVVEMEGREHLKESFELEYRNYQGVSHSEKSRRFHPDDLLDVLHRAGFVLTDSNRWSDA